MYRIGGFMVIALLAATPVGLFAEVIDRIAAVVNRDIITLSDLEREQKFQAANQGKVFAVQGPSEGEERAEMLQKLVDQDLIRQQIQQFPGIEVSEAEVEKQIAAMVKESGSVQNWEQLLGRLQITQQDLKEHVTWQLQVMKFFDHRFRQFVVVHHGEIESYYREKFLPELAVKGIQEQPPLAEVREKIRALLTEEKVNLQIDDWIKSLRESASIEIFD
jgi:peptidyl-prolyl cis-trans isomerase SurA